MEISRTNNECPMVRFDDGFSYEFSSRLLGATVCIPESGFYLPKLHALRNTKYGSFIFGAQVSLFHLFRLEIILFNMALSGEERFPLRAWELVCYCIIFIVGAIGNSIVCLVVLKSGPNFRSVPFNVYLMALAFTDLLISVLGLPIYIMSTSAFPHPSGKSGESMCKAITGYLIPFWLGGASIYLLVFISFERYSAINRPMQARMKTASKKTAFCIVSSWLIGLIIQIPTIVGVTYVDKAPMVGNCCVYTWKTALVRDSIYACTFTFQYGIPALLFIFNFVRIRNCLAKLDNTLKFAFGSGNLKQQLQVMKRKRRTVRTVFFASLAFFVCWTPNNIMFFLFQYVNVSKIDWHSVLFQSGMLLGFASSCINPLLYCFQSKEFRSHCKRVIKKMYSKSPHFAQLRNETTSSSSTLSSSSSQKQLVNFSL